MARKILPLPSGWEPLRNKERQYRNSITGQTISRRAMQTMQYGMSAESMAAERRAVRIATGKSKTGKSRYASMVETYKKKTAAKLGIKPSQVKVRGQSKEAIEFRQKTAALRKLTSDELKDKSPGGKLAKLLEDLNLRQKDAQYPVNESPDKDQDQ